MKMALIFFLCLHIALQIKFKFYTVKIFKVIFLCQKFESFQNDLKAQNLQKNECYHAKGHYTTEQNYTKQIIPGLIWPFIRIYIDL